MGIFLSKIASFINHLTPNDQYRGRTAPLTYKYCFLYIYSTNIGTEYFKHALYSPLFSSKCSLFHIANLFGSCIIHILYTGCAKIKKNNSGSKGLRSRKTKQNKEFFQNRYFVHTLTSIGQPRRLNRHSNYFYACRNSAKFRRKLLPTSPEKEEKYSLQHW